ncbi:MAG: HlyD family efflux transporter periplasmic adaptor subunit [Planctomycetes bacterium]|nr:HlyD family efflux transporter periplasmic adaptor subunit [Planctomycetota bacterium]
MRKRNRTNVKVRQQGKAGGWVMLVIVVGVAAAGIWAVKAKKVAGAGSSIGSTFTVRQDDLIVTVSEGGSIRAHSSIQYKCEVERRGAEVTILKIVPAGTYVTQEDVDNGMVLVQLDSSQLEDQLVQEQMELTQDRENASAADEAYKIQGIQNESDIAQGKLKIRFALLELQKYLGVELAGQLTADVNSVTDLTAHVAPVIAQAVKDPNLLGKSGAAQEFKAAGDKIDLAVGGLKKALATYEGTQKLHDANYVSDLELQSDELSVDSSTFNQENANIDLDLLWRFDFPMAAEEKLSNYIEALRDLERTHAECRSMLAQAQAKLSSANQQYQHQEERFQELEQQIEYCVMRAKAPGLVIYGSGDSGDAFRMMRGRSGGGGSGIIAEGEAVYQGQALISMPDTAAMVAEIGVHETEVDKVRAGQAATIVMDAFPDQILKGEVLEVAPLPDQSRSFMSPDLKVYKTLVRIDGTHDFLRTRMSCKVTMLAQKIVDAVIVPIHVVANRQNEKVVYVPKSSGSEKRVVETGAFNDTFVEIKSGLEPGEKVLLNPPLFAEGAGTNDAFKDQDATGPAAPRPKRGGPRGPAGMNRSGRPGSGTRSTTPGQGGGQVSEAMKERFKNMSAEERKAAVAEMMKKRSGNAGGKPGQKGPSSPQSGALAGK